MSAPPSPHDSVLRLCVILLTGFAVLVALKQAEIILAPVLVAIVVGVILAPTADRIERLGLPRWLVVTAFLLVGFLLISALIYMVEPFFWRIVEEMPRIRSEIRQLLFEWRNLIRGLDEVKGEVEQALGGGNGGGTEDEAGESSVPKVTDALFLAPVVGSQILVFLGTLFYFLLTRDRIYQWLSVRIGTRGDTDIMLRRFCNAEEVVARYFLTISIINIGLGLALAGALTAFGMPGAMMWGVFAALMNFVLYLGPVVVTVSLALAGMVVYTGAVSFLPPLIFLGLNVVEAQFVTPAFVGKNLDVNPLMIFLSLVFWLWLWGPLGGIVAIPTLVILLKLFDIFGEHPTEEERARAAAAQ